MNNKRLSYSKAQEVELLTQVERRCPTCGKPLFYRKHGQDRGIYELAHIYPLNPTAFEVVLLQDVPRLAENVNHPDNLIPLCRNCHKRFDSPRTVEEYQDLYTRKRALIERSRQHLLQTEYPLETEISRIIAVLYAEDRDRGYAELDYDPKRLEEKFGPTMTALLKHKIRNAVAEYYPYIKRELLQMEREDPTTTEMIATQIKLFYLEQSRLGLPQPEVFRNLTDWIRFRNIVSRTRGRGGGDLLLHSELRGVLMITPNKVVTLEQSALGRIGAILEQGPHPVSVGGLYQAVRSQFDSVDQFMLSMDILYMLDRIHVDFKTRLVTYVG